MPSFTIPVFPNVITVDEWVKNAGDAPEKYKDAAILTKNLDTLHKAYKKIPWARIKEFCERKPEYKDIAHAVDAAMDLRKEYKGLREAFANSRFTEAIMAAKNFSGISTASKFKAAHPDAADYLHKKMRPALESFHLKTTVVAIKEQLLAGGVEKHNFIKAKALNEEKQLRFMLDQVGRTINELEKIIW
ncbi:hypothetical protein [Ereboglobus luteus]|nr:hypothetical protein [Ereboglobus luteus]